MYVCICHGVTEKDIKKAVKAGAQSLQDIKQATGCATGCGTCADVALEVLQNANDNVTPDFLKILQPKSKWQEQATA